VMTVEIKPLSGTNFAAWQPLWKDYLTFYNAVVGDDVTSQSFERLTGDHPCHGRLSGLAGWQSSRHGQLDHASKHMDGR
jgi:hypothetical protein